MFSLRLSIDRGGDGMSRRNRRSLISSVRISLLSVGGAFGLLALSAGAAQAVDAGERNLLGSVTSVVESVTTPVESVVQNISGPLGGVVEAVPVEAVAPIPSNQNSALPAVSDVIQNVPPAIANISAVETVAPVTSLVDAAVSELPVVNVIVPPGTTTAVTQPVLEAVDAAAAPVLPPVQEVVTPVVEVLVPVAETLDPVVEVVHPVVDPVVEVLEPVTDPVIEVVRPTAPDEIVAPLPEPVSVDPPVLPEAPTEPSVADPQVSAEEEVATLMAPIRLPGEALPAAQEAPETTVVSGSVTVDALATDFHPADSPHGAVYALQGLPDLAVADLQQSDGSVGIAAGNAASGAAAAGSAGASSPYAADSHFSFDFSISSLGASQFGYLAALSSGPTFDPGSTPD